MMLLWPCPRHDGFGYLQHLVSFSPIASDGYPNGILVQVARGVTAVLVFAIVVLGRRRASAVYRVGLLAMIAGFMLMAFLFGTNLFWVYGRHHHQRLHDPRPCSSGSPSRKSPTRSRATAENHRAHAAAGRAVLPVARVAGIML